MSEFKIKFKEANKAKEDLGNYLVKVNEIITDVYRVKESIRWEVQSRYDIDYKLLNLIKCLEKNNHDLAMYKNQLDLIIEEYRSTELRLIGVNEQSKVIDKVVDFVNGASDFVIESLYNIVKEATGPFGRMADLYLVPWHAITELSRLDGDDDINDLSNIAVNAAGSAAGDIVGLLGDIASVEDGSPLVEWAKNLSESKVLSYEGVLSDALDGYTNFSSLRKGFSTVCNWASEIIASGVNNYKEYQEGGMNEQRYFEETINEAGLAIAENIALSALVGTAAVALGVTTAPGWVIAGTVALAAVVIDAGLNSIVKYATDGAEVEWKDAFSDFYLDYRYDPIGGIKAYTSAEINLLTKAVGDVTKITNTLCEWGTLLVA